MRIILSRKGFDSVAGGCPSPILPDGRLFSLPIPDKASSIGYSDIQFDGLDIGELVAQLTKDPKRTAKIVSEVELAFSQGRKILVLTERTEHVDALEAELKGRVHNFFTLHGRVPKKQRIARMHDLDSLPPDAPGVLVATGKLVGEGFDHPALDTLVLAMPISWKGILQPYAGRLHRAHADKADVRVIDFVDAGNVALMRMWDKRQAGYKAMGYRMGCLPSHYGLALGARSLWIRIFDTASRHLHYGVRRLVPKTTFNKVKKPQNDTNYGSSATFMVPMFHVEP